MKKLLSILLAGSCVAIPGGALAADPASASVSEAATATKAPEAGTKPATVKRFINHVDHVCWLTRDENLDAAAKKMAAMAGAKWDGPNVREALGIRQYLSWEAGLEIIAPQAGCTTDLCKQLNAVLETRGEGIWSVIIGKPNIRRALQHGRKALDGKDRQGLGSIRRRFSRDADPVQ
jgi:hypothetical protein